MSDYLWPHNPYLSPAWRLHTRPMPPLTDHDDIYRRCLLALVDTLAADTYDVLSRLAQLPAQTPLRTIHDFNQLTNDFSVTFMSFSRLQREERPKPAQQSNNPLISFVTGIETGMRIMVRLLRLVFDKFAASVHRLPTEEDIHAILVPQLRHSHHLLTLLARGNLIDVNTRNRVLMGHTDPWFDPACFDYKHLTSAGEASWEGSLAHLRDYRLFPSSAARAPIRRDATGERNRARRRWKPAHGWLSCAGTPPSGERGPAVRHRAKTRQHPWHRSERGRQRHPVHLLSLAGSARASCLRS